MKISVIGAGYLGAVHAACMARIGHEVCAYDTDEGRIQKLSSGGSPFYEPGFDELLADALDSGRLRFTARSEEAVADATVHFVCVGTPQMPGSTAADVWYVDSAMRSVAANANCDGLIVGKSMVPVGTAQRLASELTATGSDGARLDVAWNPEFLREGKAIADTLRPDRLVFGVTSKQAEDTLIQVYGSLIDEGVPYLTADLATAEMVKVASNSFLATKISFINAIAEVCDAVGADVVKLADALGYDDRIGRRYLNAGLGFGGGCLPKDIRAFSARAGELGVSELFQFLHEVDKVNIRRREKAVAVACALVDGDFLGKSIAVLGAAFKPDSDDVRDSPALNVAAAKHLRGADVRVHDPKAVGNARATFPTLTYAAIAEEACRDVDLVVLATEWQEYFDIDPRSFRSVVRTPRLLDTRNALDREQWSAAGWDMHALGRGALPAARRRDQADVR
jgi:UDPglucose 6-dehydrogenase